MVELTSAEEREVAELMRQRQCRCEPTDFTVLADYNMATLSTGRVVLLPATTGIGWFDPAYRFPCPVHQRQMADATGVP